MKLAQFTELGAMVNLIFYLFILDNGIPCSQEIICKTC